MPRLTNLNQNSFNIIAKKLNKKTLTNCSCTSKSMKSMCKSTINSQKRKTEAICQIQKSYRDSQRKKIKKILNNGKTLVNNMISHQYYPNNIEDNFNNNILNQYKISERQRVLILKQLIHYFILKSYSPNFITNNNKIINYILKTTINKGIGDLNEMIFEYKRHFK